MMRNARMQLIGRRSRLQPRRWPVAVAMGAVAAWICCGAAYGQSVERSVLSSAGGVTRAGSTVLVSSLGQPHPVGVSTGGGYTLVSGFVAAGEPAAPPLVIEHDPPPVQEPGEAVTISITAVGFQSATLHYHSGSGALRSAAMALAGENTFEASIPAADITADGVAYYVTARTAGGTEMRFPQAGSLPIQVAVSGSGLSFRRSLPGGTEETAYRIVSVPLLLQNRSPAALLEDDLGAYDDTEWRLFEQVHNTATGQLSLVEFSNIGAIEPGKGYWLITREGGRTIDTGPGTSIPLSRPFAIPVHPGWNLVGNPFNFTVRAQQLRMKSGQPVALRSFTGSWNDPINDRVTEVAPFEGYALHNDSSAVDSLLVFPEPSGAGKQAALARSDALEWMVKISAASEGYRDHDNVIAVSQQASDAWDPLDYPEPPPPIGRSVSVHFPHPEWNRLSERYSTDVRVPSATGHAWALEVNNTTGGTIDLSFDGLASIPAELDVWLYDELARAGQNLRASPRYTLAGSKAAFPRSLKVVIGTADYVRASTGLDEEMPTSLHVAEIFPNPFTQSVTIRYGLPSDAAVTTTIYNVLGEQIVILAEGAATSAGYHAAVWDGMTQWGTPAPSGIYFVRVAAGGEQATGKLVLVR